MRRSESGFTLVEIMLSLGLTSFLFLGGLTVVNSLIDARIALSDKLAGEEEISLAGYMLKRQFSMALNLTESPVSLAGSTFVNNIGQVARYAMTDWAPTTGPGRIDLLSYFIRENLSSGSVAAIAASTLPATGRFPLATLFFQRPTIDKYGVIYVEGNTQVGVGLTGRGLLQPQDSSTKVSYVVDLSIQEIFSQPFRSPDGQAIDADLQGRKMVSAITIKVVQRDYYGKARTTGVMTWCPPQFMPGGASESQGCATTVPYRDTERTFTLNVRNNVLGRSFSQRGKDLESLGSTSGVQKYYPYYRRSSDGVYFLRSNLPIATLSR